MIKFEYLETQQEFSYKRSFRNWAEQTGGHEARSGTVEFAWDTIEMMNKRDLVPTLTISVDESVVPVIVLKVETIIKIEKE